MKRPVGMGAGVMVVAIMLRRPVAVMIACHVMVVVMWRGLRATSLIPAMIAMVVVAMVVVMYNNFLWRMLVIVIGRLDRRGLARLAASIAALGRCERTRAKRSTYCKCQSHFLDNLVHLSVPFFFSVSLQGTFPVAYTQLGNI